MQLGGTMEHRYDAKALSAFATGLFEAAGLASDKAGTIAPLLVDEIGRAHV